MGVLHAAGRLGRTVGGQAAAGELAVVGFDGINGSEYTLPPLTTWRQNGGLIISDDLGTQAVRRFYDPDFKNFSARLVARDAFLAGNDLLYMGNIESTETPDNYSTLLATFDFFTQKYREDSAFARRVDDAVTRILTVKYHLYNYFSPNLVIPDSSRLSVIGTSQSQAVTSEVARQSATLISPDNSISLETILPSPPGQHDQIVFLTDTRPEIQCSTCKTEPMMAVDELQKVITRLYGPQSGGQVQAWRMISYAFDSLSAILPGGGGNESLEGSLNSANWVIINMLDAEPGQTQTVTLTLPPDAFARYDTTTHAWKTDPGEYSIEVGNSSRSLPLRLTLQR